MHSEKPKRSIEGEIVTEACISDDLLLSYFEGSLAASQAQAVQRHLNSCKACFDVMASLIKNSLYPPSERELAELEKIAGLDPEAQLAKLFPRPVPAPSSLFERFKKIFAPKITTIPYLKPAIALAFLLFAVILALPFIKERRSNDLTEDFRSTLVEYYKINSRDELRPAGGFEYDEFTVTLEPENILHRAPDPEKLQAALNLNRHNFTAHQYWGTYYLFIAEDLKKAEEHYLRAYDLDSTNSSVLNDLGVLASRQGAYREAIEKFASAIKHGPRLLEAQYNLALLYQKQDKRQEAKREWEKYLELDPSSLWADVARDHLNRLNQ
jgi:tetratricopeptide (TPR) repeat protein